MTRLRGGGKGERIAHEPRGREVARVDSAGIARRLSLFLPVFAFSLQNGASKKAVMGRKVDVTFRSSQ